MALEPIKKGDVIRADWLNRLAREAGLTLQPGWGSGLVSSGRGQVASQVDYLTAMFKAQEDFAEAEDIYKGNAKLWWYNPVASAYEEHGADVEVWSHEDGVEEGDIFPAFFNQQSGRWERIGGGGSGGEILAPDIQTTVNCLCGNCKPEHCSDPNEDCPNCIKGIPSFFWFSAKVPIEQREIYEADNDCGKTIAICPTMQQQAFWLRTDGCTAFDSESPRDDPDPVTHSFVCDEGEDEYEWELTIGDTPTNTTLIYKRVSGENCREIYLVYRKAITGFRCLCQNLFFLDEESSFGAPMECLDCAICLQAFCYPTCCEHAPTHFDMELFFLDDVYPPYQPAFETLKIQFAWYPDYYISIRGKYGAWVSNTFTPHLFWQDGHEGLCRRLVLVCDNGAYLMYTRKVPCDVDDPMDDPDPLPIEYGGGSGSTLWGGSPEHGYTVCTWLSPDRPLPVFCPPGSYDPEWTIHGSANSCTNYSCEDGSFFLCEITRLNWMTGDGILGIRMIE